VTGGGGIVGGKNKRKKETSLRKFEDTGNPNSMGERNASVVTMQPEKESKKRRGIKTKSDQQLVRYRQGSKRGVEPAARSDTKQSHGPFILTKTIGREGEKA